MSSKYDTLFDKLIPRIFRYNDGNSGRLHAGYIAQEVDGAVALAGLTREDFAAVCIDSEGTNKELWGLRYDEFIPLNTWQIQKLKPRVATLEEKVEALETKVATLEAENAQLKSQLI